MVYFYMKSIHITAASPDDIANCKYHGKTLIEIKYQFNTRNKTTQEGIVRRGTQSPT